MKRYELEHCGGRSLDDIQQYCFSVYSKVKDNWPINEVPKDVKQQLDGILEDAQSLNNKLENLFDMVIQEKIEK